MTQASPGGPPPPGSLSVALGGRARGMSWWRTPTARRYLLGTTLAFLLLQPFKGRKVIRALVVIPFTLPIAVSVLGWKWMFDSQFSVINWALSRLSLIGTYGSPDWPVWLGQPGLALLSVM